MVSADGSGIGGIASGLGFDRWLSDGLLDSLFPVIQFVLLLFVYAVLVWHFHRFVARRDFFRFDGVKWVSESAWGKTRDVLLYVGEYVVLYPVLEFIFFFAYAILLLLLSRSLSLEGVLVTSISLVSAIRIASYYKEDLARELAKLFPLVVLSVFLAEPTLISMDGFFAKIAEIPAFFRLSLQFVLFVVLLEWSLRFLRGVVVWVRETAGLPDPSVEELLDQKAASALHPRK
jgi:hypothetical protein